MTISVHPDALLLRSEQLGERSGVLIDVDSVEDLQRLAVDPLKPRPSGAGMRSLG